MKDDHNREHDKAIVVSDHLKKLTVYNQEIVKRSLAILDDLLSAEEGIIAFGSGLDTTEKRAVSPLQKPAEIGIDGAGRINSGAEASFDVLITYKGKPYPDNELPGVMYFVFDPNEEQLASGEAELVVDGHYIVTLDKGITVEFKGGVYRLEVLLDILDAIPSPTIFEFVVE